MDLVGYLNNAIIECRILPDPLVPAIVLPANDIARVSIVCLHSILTRGIRESRGEENSKIVIFNFNTL